MAVLDLSVDSKCLVRHIEGHFAHSSPRLVPLPPSPEVDIVDVAAGSVGHHRDKWRIDPIGPDQLLNPIGEDREIVCADMSSSVAADVVQAVVDKQRQRSAVGMLYAHDRQFRIGRSGRLQQIFAGPPWIHPHAIRFPSKRIGRDGPIAHVPAAIEDMLRHRADCPTDPRRSQVCDRSAHSVGDASGHEVAIPLIQVGCMHSDHCRSGVSVRRGDEQVLRRQTRCLTHQLLDVFNDFAANHSQIANGKGNSGPAVVQSKAAYAEFVMDMLGQTAAGDHAAIGRSQRQRDVAGRRPCSQAPGFRSRSPRDQRRRQHGRRTEKTTARHR